MFMALSGDLWAKKYNLLNSQPHKEADFLDDLDDKEHSLSTHSPSRERQQI